MTVTYRKVTLGNQEFALVLGKEKRLIAFEGHVYDRFEDFVENFPEMKNPKEVVNIAQIANFMFAPDMCEVILDPSKFKMKYKKLLEMDQRAKEFGIFNVSEIIPPRISGKQLLFYVQDVGNGIPYKVTGQFPPINDLTYSNLPFE